MWLTNGERAGIVAARRSHRRTGIRGSRREGAGADLEGITVSRQVHKLGYRGIETVELAYTDHRVPAAALGGEKGRASTR